MSIDYTKIDQDEVRNELITLLKATSTFRDANFSGTALYDLTNVLSYNAALFGFYLNNIANEPFIDTAKQYKNINRIANSLLYNPIGKGSASVAIASSLSKDYVLRNTEGFIEVPTYSQFPSTRLSSDGENFAFTNNKPLVIQVQQFGVSFLRDGDVLYTGDIIGGTTVDPKQLVLPGQKKKPIQIVETSEIAIVEEDISSVAHDTLTTFVVDTEYSMVIQKVSDTYNLIIRPKTTQKLDNEIMRFKINSQRQVVIEQNFSSNKIYLGRTGFRNLVNTRFEITRQVGNVNRVGRVNFIVPRFAPAFEVLWNGEVYAFSNNDADIIISSEDIEQGKFETTDDINIVLNLTDTSDRFYGAKLDLKKTSDLLTNDIVIGLIPTATITDGNIIAADESAFLTGETKSGNVDIFEGETVKLVTFDVPFNFDLPTENIPLNNSKNYSIFLYGNDNIRTFYTEKTTEGFIINVEPETGFTGKIYWNAVAYERAEVKEERIDITNLQGLFDTGEEYSVLLQPGLNVLAWSADKNENGFKVLSDVSFLGDVDYLILPNNSFDLVGNPKLSGVEYISKGETEFRVTFDKSMENADYQIFLQPEDNTNVWFEDKTTDGFLIRIEPDTDFFGKVDWQVYSSTLSGTVTFGGGDLFVDQITVEYQDLRETSYLGFVSQGLVKMTQIDESGLLSDGLNGLELDYDTDITINPGLSFTVEDTTISYNNLRAFVKITGTWVEFEQADNYQEEITSSSRVFYVRVNKDQKISIKFGNDDARGFDPTGNLIVILGMQCVGKDGNIGENVLDDTIVGSLNFQTSDLVTESVEATFIDLIRVKRDAFFDGISTSYLIDYANAEVSSTDLTVNQIGAGIFGTEPEGVESIRNNAQFAHRSQDRLVTETDYKTIVQNQFGDFIIDVEVFNYKEAKANGLIPQGEDERNFYNTLFFMMVPLFGTSFSLSQRDAINTYLNDRAKRMAGIDINIQEPSFIPIDVMISFAHKIGASPIQIRNNITSGVYDYFKRENRQLGETITLDSIRNSIVSTDITELNIMINRDEKNEFTVEDYDVDIVPTEFEDAFQEVQEQKLRDTVKKEIRNLIGKGLIQLKQPLFDIQYPTGERKWSFTGEISLGRFEFPILGDLGIERKV